MWHSLRLFTLFFSLVALTSFSSAASRRSKSGEPALKVQPAFWWSDMHDASLQLLLHAPEVGRSEVTLDAHGVSIDSIVRPTNTNYLLLYLQTKHAPAQTFSIHLRKDGKVKTLPYELRQRNQRTRAQGFDASDVVYLLMPDRFVNGDPSNDVVKGLKEQTASQEPNARHGGDLVGMTKALDYLNDLGVTTVWPTPLQVNDMPSTSYHGYAITDYYEIDPRFGGNEAYVRFIDEAHKRGMKVIQDMVFNHCGSENFLFRDRPDDDWFYVSSTQFPSDGSPVYLQVGSSAPDTHILYTAISGDSIIANSCNYLNNEVVTHKIVYDESYGNGLLVNVAWVKNGKVYTHSAELRKPLPDKKLRMAWTTFRDRLTPGQQEEWTLSIELNDSLLGSGACVSSDPDHDKAIFASSTFPVDNLKAVNTIKVSCTYGGPLRLDYAMIYANKATDDINLATLKIFIPVPPKISLQKITAKAQARASIQSGVVTGMINGMMIPLTR